MYCSYSWALILLTKKLFSKGICYKVLGCIWNLLFFFLHSTLPICDIYNLAVFCAESYLINPRVGNLRQVGEVVSIECDAVSVSKAFCSWSSIRDISSWQERNEVAESNDHFQQGLALVVNLNFRFLSNGSFHILISCWNFRYLSHSLVHRSSLYFFETISPLR